MAANPLSAILSGSSPVLAGGGTTPAPPALPAAEPAPVPKTDDTDNNPLAASKPDPKRIGFPSGMTLEVPGNWTDGVVNTLSRELHSAATAVLGLPGSLYHAAADPETPEESARFGKGFEKKIGPTGRLIDRSAVQPVLNALSDYGHGRVTVDDLLANLPEALGGAGGTVLAGKAASDIGTVGKQVLEKTLNPAKSPVAQSSTPSPITQAEPGASAADVESDLPGKKGPVTSKGTLTRLITEEHGSAGAPGTVGGNADQLAPTFFSKAEQVANQKVSTGSGDSMLAALRNNGVKESEIQWLGLDDYLKGEPKVSKSDLQQYINEHKIALNETNLGGNDWKNVRDLTVNRNKVYAENNRIWADHLRYADGSSDLFNAMKEGTDLEPVIAKMPSEVQQPARRFVETDQQIRDLDKQIGDAEKGVAPSKYESYTLPGDKDNYTEKLLTLPSENSDVRQAYENAENERNTYISTGSLVPGDVELRFQDAQTAMRKAANTGKTFQSSHFDEPNVLAHSRFDDRTSLDGKKTLLLEELQSDWHQKGKQVGYQNPAPTTLPDGIFISPEDGQFQVVNREGNPLLSRLFGSEREAQTAALTHYGEGAGNPGVPDAPFKSDWHELVIKRMLRHAAENGYDRLAWTTGEQQAARYDLSKHIDSLDWMKNNDGTYSVAGNKAGSEDEGAYQEPVELFRKEQIAPDELDEVVGKSVAEKIRNQEGKNYQMQGTHNMGSLKGLDLKLGGEWAKALYDRAIPNFLNKYAKKWGAKVGSTEVDTTPSGSLRYEIVDPKGNVQDAFRNRAGADDAVTGYNEAHHGVGKWTVRDNGTTDKVHSIDITPAMKKSVLHEGQPIAKETGRPSALRNVLDGARTTLA